MNGTILYKEISGKIIDDIVSGYYALGQSLPCHEELCKKYKVSLVTVKKALKRCEEQGYIDCCRGRRAKVSMSAIEKFNRTKRIIILDVIDRVAINSERIKNQRRIIPPICDEWHSQIKKGIIENLSEEYNAICMTYYSDDIFNDYDSTLLPEAEVVVIVVGSSPSVVSFLQSKGKKVLAFSADKFMNCCRVMNDDYSLSRSAVDYLISQGHKRIAFLGVGVSDHPVGDFYLRQKGYQDALIEAGLPIDGKYIRLLKYSSADMGYYYMNDILNSYYVYGCPTAVFCADDIIAYGALAAIKDNLYRCPEDISIIGVDNYQEICQYSDPPLSSVEKNFRITGKRFAEIIMSCEWSNNENLVEGNIVIRKSIAKANNG